jgi:hypothetical protein
MHENRETSSLTGSQWVSPAGEEAEVQVNTPGALVTRLRSSCLPNRGPPQLEAQSRRRTRPVGKRRRRAAIVGDWESGCPAWPAARDCITLAISPRALTTCSRSAGPSGSRILKTSATRLSKNARSYAFDCSLRATRTSRRSCSGLVRTATPFATRRSTKVGRGRQRNPH